MKYLRLFEDFDSYDPYELMIIPPNKKGEMIIDEIRKPEPNLNLVRDLITLGANVDWQDKENYDQTALHMAARKHQIEIAMMLIDAGANLDIQDYNDRTALHWAAVNDHPHIAQMLVDAGANLDIQDYGDRTALHWAAEYNRPEIARMLVGSGASKDILNNDGEPPYDLATTQEMKKLLKP
jgi:ankyrin repeat protein